MHKLFEFLDNKSLTKDADFYQLKKWKNDNLIKFIKEIHQLDLNEKNNSSSIFSFSANEELSSGRNPCFDIKCRLIKIDELIQFAILYSDNVFIYNPFEKYQSIVNWKDFVKMDIINDLIILNYLKPLINKNIIRFAHGYEIRCNSCRNKIISKFEGIIKEIETSILATSRFKLQKINNKYALRISGNADIFGHKETGILLNYESKYDKYFYEDDSYILTQEDIVDLRFAKNRSEEIMFDLLRQDANVNTLNNNYLIANNFYLELLHKINNTNLGGISPNDIVSGLSHAVPAIRNTNVHNLLSLRENDYESFLVYRDSIRKLINETFEKKDFSDLKSAFNDIVLPELNKINLAVKKNKKILSYKTKKEIIISVGIIGLGVFSGILPHDFGKLFGAIGGCKFAQALISQLIDLNNPEYNILDNKYYFIWKMNQELNKAAHYT